MKRCLWVGEILLEHGWEPTTGAHLDKKSAGIDRGQWLLRNPDDKYRIVKYVPVKP